MAGIPRFFKIPQHKRFNYQPLYYDEEKERREERRKRIRKELGKSEADDHYVPNITRGSMRGYFDKSRRAKKQSNLRLVILVLFLIFVSYFLFFR